MGDRDSLSEEPALRRIHSPEGRKGREPSEAGAQRAGGKRDRMRLARETGPRRPCGARFPARELRAGPTGPPPDFPWPRCRRWEAAGPRPPRRRGSGEARPVAQREDVGVISQQSLLTDRTREQKGVRGRKDSRVVPECGQRTGWTPVRRGHL